MRILGLGDYGDLGDLYLHMQARGHEVRMHIADPAYHEVFAGMVQRCADWRSELDWLREAGRDGLIICETAHQGTEQDALRASGFNVIGGSALGDRLEGDRIFGQEVLRGIGMNTAPVQAFRDFSAAIAYIEERPRRYVCKHNGHHLPSTSNYVGVLDDGSDVIALLRSQRRRWPADAPPDFVLMDHIEGVETGVGAYFDGQAFIQPACLDWEHKRFFPGNIGELTGEMGTIVTYRGSDRLFQEALAPLAPMLAEGGYRGYINVNTIINRQGVWPLEVTCRFGYPGFAILDALQPGGWEEVLGAMLGRQDGIGTLDGYAAGVVLTVPPFPYLDAAASLAQGLPICFRGALGVEERRHLHLGEVALGEDGLVTSGVSGYVLVATGVGDEVPEARGAAYALLDKVVVPNGRYRRDIGESFLDGDGELLFRLGYLPSLAGELQNA